MKKNMRNQKAQRAQSPQKAENQFQEKIGTESDQNNSLKRQTTNHPENPDRRKGKQIHGKKHSTKPAQHKKKARRTKRAKRAKKAKTCCFTNGMSFAKSGQAKKLNSTELTCKQAGIEYGSKNNLLRSRIKAFKKANHSQKSKQFEEFKINPNWAVKSKLKSASNFKPETKGFRLKSDPKTTKTKSGYSNHKNKKKGHNRFGTAARTRHRKHAKTRQTQSLDEHFQLVNPMQQEADRMKREIHRNSLMQSMSQLSFMQSPMEMYYKPDSQQKKENTQNPMQMWNNANWLYPMTGNPGFDHHDMSLPMFSNLPLGQMTYQNGQNMMSYPGQLYGEFTPGDVMYAGSSWYEIECCRNFIQTYYPNWAQERTIDEVIRDIQLEESQRYEEEKHRRNNRRTKQIPGKKPEGKIGSHDASGTLKNLPENSTSKQKTFTSQVEKTAQETEKPRSHEKRDKIGSKTPGNGQLGTKQPRKESMKQNQPTDCSKPEHQLSRTTKSKSDSEEAECAETRISLMGDSQDQNGHSGLKAKKCSDQSPSKRSERAELRPDQTQDKQAREYFSETAPPSFTDTVCIKLELVGNPDDLNCRISGGYDNLECGVKVQVSQSTRSKPEIEQTRETRYGQSKSDGKILAQNLSQKDEHGRHNRKSKCKHVPKFSRQSIDSLKEKKPNQHRNALNAKCGAPDHREPKQRVELLLGHLTEHTVASIQPELEEYCSDRELAHYIMDRLIQKASGHADRRDCYAGLVKSVSSASFKWEHGREVSSFDGQKVPTVLRGYAMAAIEKQCSQSLAEYQTFTQQVHDDSSLGKEQKAHKIFSKKNQLLNYLLLMAQLFMNGTIRMDNFKWIMAHGLVQLCRSFIEQARVSSRIKRAILLDYVEVLIELWKDVGYHYEHKQAEEAGLQNESGDGAASEGSDLEVVRDLTRLMKQAKLERPFDSENDLKIKSMFGKVQNLFRVLSGVLSFIRSQNVMVRLDSVIERFQKRCERGWEPVFFSQESNQQSKFTQSHVNRQNPHEKNPKRAPNPNEQKASKRSRRNRIHQDENSCSTNFDSRKPRKVKDTTSKAERKHKPADRSVSDCVAETKRLLRNFRTNKQFDAIKFKQIWTVGPKKRADMPELLQEYLVIFMDHAWRDQVELRKRVIYDWADQGSLDSEQFIRGFNSGYKVNFRDFASKFEYPKQLSQVLCWMVVNHGLDLTSVDMSLNVQGRNLVCKGQIEGLRKFYSVFLGELKQAIREIEDRAVRVRSQKQWKQLVQESEKILGI